MNKAPILLAFVWMGVPCGPAQDKPAVAMIGTGNLAGMLGPALGQREAAARVWIIVLAVPGEVVAEVS